MIEFAIYNATRVGQGTTVFCGYCGPTAIRVGEIFTTFCWKQIERDDGTGELVTLDAGTSGPVALRVEEIGYYGSTTEFLPPGHSAALRLLGTGLEFLQQIDFEAERNTGRWWSLRGGSDTESGTRTPANSADLRQPVS
ncbi:hypothetical protein [Gemmata sp.]|uniref:hypothetical protein n=1 Tax=Gemmata sp. TaxID=1914242 RepID=UPI003F6FD5CB